MENTFISVIRWLLTNIWDLISQFIRVIIDGLAAVLPSTPENLKLSAFLLGYVEANDFMSYLFIQVAQGCLGILTIVIIYKTVKILPLT